MCNIFLYTCLAEVYKVLEINLCNCKGWADISKNTLTEKDFGKMNFTDKKVLKRHKTAHDRKSKSTFTQTLNNKALNLCSQTGST